jgi:hypothetical protein
MRFSEKGFPQDAKTKTTQKLHREDGVYFVNVILSPRKRFIN